MDDTLIKNLDRLNEIGISLSTQKDTNKLLESILRGAKLILNADAGTIYSTAEDGRSLNFEIILNDSLGMHMGGTSGVPIRFPPLPLYRSDGSPNTSMVAACTALHHQTINIPDAYQAEGFDFSGTRAFDQRTGYNSRSFLTVPMLNHESELIGILQLINAKDQDGANIIPFSRTAQRLAESLASQAAIALTNNRLVAEFQELFEAFISLIAKAIDEKSPYTGGHCRRVPDLTMMIAEAACRAEYGIFRDFDMTSAELYELKIAGLLHDCGKVTTPVHVIDKATKLETIFDRIHLIETRFAVLKRDAEISYLQTKLAHLESGNQHLLPALKQELQTKLAQLEDDRHFIRHCNIGAEFMRPELQQRVQQIAKYQWRNHQGEMVDFLTENELQNLCVAKGTLTPAERQIINHHMTVTIEMLEALPYPKNLRRVPEYAGGHHERMDGKGYPKGLTREQMSLPARMMGIADIFEALSANDRPYKQGKTLSECLFILGKMQLDNHIDPDLFDLFVREKVYLDYAHRYLDPAQIDEVDETKIPGYTSLHKPTQIA